MVKAFWIIALLVCFGACAALIVGGCGGAPVVVTASAIECHHKTLAAVANAETCNDALIAVEHIIATDPDCRAVYQDAGSGLHCRDDDGGAGGR